MLHRHKLLLKFPNARLFVHGLISCDRSSAPEAIARSACEFGLVGSDFVDEMIPSPGASPCPCMAAARNVITKYCQARTELINMPKLDGDDIWSALQQNVEIYNGELLANKEESDLTHNSHECSKFAPALFDLLLQELHRHP